MADTIRLERRRGFTILPNDLVGDKRLTLKTKGLMAVLLSRPDDWHFSVAGLAAFCGVGKDAIRSALGELEAAGYLTREAIREGGKFAGTEYIIRDHAEPAEDGPVSPVSGFPTTVKPTPEKPTPENPTGPNKDITQQGLNNTPYSPPRGTEAAKYKPEWFEAFWKAYPRKADRKKAIRAWDKLKPDRALCETMNRALTLQKRSAQWQKEGGAYIPMPSTWLNGQRWTDAAPPPGPPDGPSGPSRSGQVEERGLKSWN